MPSTVGGVRDHRIPREGGNTLNATFFGSFANGDMQGSNLTDSSAIADCAPDSIKTNFEVNAGFGGPIKRDKLWFYFAARQLRSSMRRRTVLEQEPEQPQCVDLRADLTQPAANEREQDDAQIQLTWQASPRHKLGVTWQEAVMCFCPQSARLTSALEAEPERSYPKRRITQLSGPPRTQTDSCSR